MEGQRKKIIYLVTKSVWAGAGKYVSDLVENLDKTKYDPWVVAGGKGVLSEKAEEFGAKYIEVKNFRRDINLFKEVFAFFELFKIFLKIRPDVIHSSSPKASGIGGGAFLLYRILTFKAKARTVHTVHGWTFSEIRPEWQKFLIRVFSKLICALHQKIIVISKKDYSLAEKFNITSPKKLILIHNGIETNSNFIEKESAREKLNLTNNKITIGTIGEYTKNKGHRYLIDAIKLLQTTDYKLLTILIGWGEEGEKLKAQSKKLGLQNNIIFIENLSPASPYLKAFDIFVFPSLKEGLPYALLEAGLAKLPIVATNIGGIPDVVEDGKTGFLTEPANPKELAKKIEILIKDKPLRDLLGQNAKEKTKREFDLKQMLEKTFKLYLGE